MSNISMTMRHEYNETPVSNVFIDRYMMRANPVYSLIYIYGMRLCLSGGGGLSSAEMAGAFDILESDVVNAWKYWAREGLVQIRQTGEEMDIVFLPVSVKSEARTEPARSEKNSPLIMATKPQYTVEELDLYQKQSKDIKAIFKHAERALGKLLTFNDLNVIFGLYDWLRMPLPLIEFLLTYCGEYERRNLNYIEKVAVDWNDKGIDTVEKAKAYVQTFNRDYRQILKALGSDSGPSPTQQKTMDKWLYTYHLPLEVILEACDLSAVAKGKATMKYVDGILQEWFKNDIKTLDAVKRNTELHDRERAKNTYRVSEKNTRFVNFDQRKNDHDELERLELEQFRQSVLKG